MSISGHVGPCDKICTLLVMVKCGSVAIQSDNKANHPFLFEPHWQFICRHFTQWILMNVTSKKHVNTTHVILIKICCRTIEQNSSCVIVLIHWRLGIEGLFFINHDYSMDACMFVSKQFISKVCQLAKYILTRSIGIICFHTRYLRAFESLKLFHQKRLAVNGEHSYWLMRWQDIILL